MVSIKSFKLKHAIFFSMALHLLFLSVLPLPNGENSQIKPPKKKWETVRIEIKKKPEIKPANQKKIISKPRKRIISPKLKPLQLAARPMSKTQPAKIVKRKIFQKTEAAAPIKPSDKKFKSIVSGKSAAIKRRTMRNEAINEFVQAKSPNSKILHSLNKPTLIKQQALKTEAFNVAIEAKAINSVKNSQYASLSISNARAKTAAISAPTNITKFSAHALKPVTRSSQPIKSNRARIVNASFKVPENRTFKATARPMNSGAVKSISKRSGIIKKAIQSNLPSHSPINPINSSHKSRQRNNVQSRAAIISYKGLQKSLSKFQAKAINFKNVNQLKSGQRKSHFVEGYQIAGLQRQIKPRAMAQVEAPVDNGLSDEEFRKIWRAYSSTILNKVKHVKKYPLMAKKNEIEGRVIVAFKVNRKGIIQNMSINKSSGHDILDSAALHAVKEAGPYDPIPNRLALQTMSFKLPISFDLN